MITIASNRMIDSLALLNLILSAAIVITSFSLSAYILIYNLRSSVARTFCALLACVMLVYLGDLLLFSVTDGVVAERWLRFQWVGIAFAPAVYLHFSDAVLRTTNKRSKWRYVLTRASYLASGLFLAGVIFTEWVVTDGVLVLRAPHLNTGPLFGLYLVYFGGSVVSGALNLVWARRRCLTSTSRRRMNYLMLSFAAPALGVFPYLLIISRPGPIWFEFFWVLLVLGNIVVGMLLVMMAYTVAYFGVLAPDRIVKYRLIHFLLRGPLVACLVVGAIIGLVPVEDYLGLQRYKLIMVVVVATIVLSQLFITLSRPFLDRIIFWQDRRELARIQRLSDHLLTSSDLQQFMENILSAVCDLLRMPAAFVLSPGPEGMVMEASVGLLAGDSTDHTSSVEMDTGGDAMNEDDLPVPRRVNGYWVWSLRGTGNDAAVLGAMAVCLPALNEPGEGGEEAGWEEENEAEPLFFRLLPEQRMKLSALIRQATTALEDRRLQQDVFAAVDRIIPELEVIQRQRSTVRYVDSPPGVIPDAGLLDGPEFATWVKGALVHYWGGPRLSDSPLLRLKVVEQALSENNDNPTRALRAVLLRAIELQRPEGERKMTAAEWLLYNILDMRFIQGQRVRDIAARLAMSESDLYRKQRIAIETVARALADMERQVNEVADQAKQSC